ncbi:alpha/beta fold hydrolase [Williamsia sp. CHRR-6]|uniref:alpha/beta fold hydrolase n=1 Tax=Williamsia sp. CHRR-6 TaxID=2835871 RepID=UPI001BDAA30F|nr:alpha/beta fold hydrolase [Williamsia sp. CHRR-6]MBT0567081.1 alpha/beta fold hydrolase [Williamsia sp. CHRR-6]
MSATTTSSETPAAAHAVEHHDVVVVGAGFGGIGAGYYLKKDLPGKSFVILEGRAASGGTWDLFKYPGIRSDSDHHCFGYEFEPWLEDTVLVDGQQILTYMRGVSHKYGIEPHIRYQRKVVAVNWSSANALWVVDVEEVDTGRRVQMTATFVLNATGYYNYDQGYTPDFPGRDRFRGQVIHPQHWPEDLDYRGKRIVVIGSGATAVTLIPNLQGAAHVVQLQRTPTYVMPVPKRDRISDTLRAVLPRDKAYAAIRAFQVWFESANVQLGQKFPKTMRRYIRRVNRRALPDQYPVDTHFNPPYDPWDQRLCASPGGDYFEAITSGLASVVTDTIETFDETGIQLSSGQHLDADIIITATGLNVRLFGGMQISVDDKPITLSETVAFKGNMLSGIPNLAFLIGYTHGSWTLKVGLLSQYFVRLLSYMDDLGYTTVVPELPEGMKTRPLMDFSAGYVQRVLDQQPRQGDAYPWVMSMSYPGDADIYKRGDVTDPDLTFGTGPARSGSDTDAADSFADVGRGITLCYRTDGDPSGEPVLLVPGLGLDLTSWPESFVGDLVDRGYHVVRFDNRDSGRSTHLNDSPMPNPLHMLRGTAPDGAYSLEDMSDDAAGLLRAIGVDRAHVIGISMGGMIAQTLAVRHPDLVSSLTSIASTTGARDVGQPAKSTLPRLLAPVPSNISEFAKAQVSLLKHIGSRSAYPIVEETETAWARRAWNRGAGELRGRGDARQIGAIGASGDRTRQLGRITAPTLVINADKDRMVAASGGAATARAIPGARHEVIEDMGHHLNAAVAARIIGLLDGHLRSAATTTPTKESVTA